MNCNIYKNKCKTHRHLQNFQFWEFKRKKLYYKFWTKSLGDLENLHYEVTELNEYSLSKFSQNTEHNYI